MNKRILAVKIILFSLLACISLYCLYAIIGQLIVWYSQPRFIAVDTGKVAASAGFLIQTIVFAVIFILVSAGTVFAGFKFFRKKKTDKEN